MTMNGACNNCVHDHVSAPCVGGCFHDCYDGDGYGDGYGDGCGDGILAQSDLVLLLDIVLGGVGYG